MMNWTKPNLTELKLSRRGMLASALGVTLGLGAKVEGAIEATSNDDPTMPAIFPGFEEYERTLSNTDQLETFGIPPSWSLVRKGFHPLTPNRVVIMRPDIINWRSDYGMQVFDRVRARLLRSPFLVDSPVPENKLRLIVRLMEIVTLHYRVAKRMEDWAFRLACREALATTGIGSNAAFPHQFQLEGIVKLNNTSVDWWLFLFPDGVDWGSCDEQPVHAMLSHVFPGRWTERPDFALKVLAQFSRAFQCVDAISSWRTVSQMNQIEAARMVNRLTIQSLSEDRSKL